MKKSENRSLSVANILLRQMNMVALDLIVLGVTSEEISEALAWMASRGSPEDG